MAATVTNTSKGISNIKSGGNPVEADTVDINSLTEKTTPVDADETIISDSAASYVNKKLTWANIKATLKTYWDTLYVKKIISTDNAIARYDGTTGEVQNSGITIDDNNNFVLPTTTQASTIGIIYKGSVKFIHNYFGNYSGLNGNNFFAGLNAGNFTSNGTSQVYQASFNVGIGDNAFSSFTTAYNCVALGYKALTLNTSGSNNFGLGAFSLEKITTGSGNTAVGTESAEYTTGSSNTIIGKRAGQGVNGSSTYSNNTAVGFQSLQSCTTGGNNTAVGYQAADLITTGTYNIIIGFDCDPSANNASNELNIGNVIKGTGMYGTGLIGINTTPHSTLHSAGSFATGYVAKTGTYTATSADHTIDCTTNTFTVTLPTAVGVTGRIYVVKNSGTGVITVATTSSQTIDGVTTKSLAAQYDKITVQSNGANWIVLSY